MKIWVIGRDYPSKQNRMRGSFEIEQAKMLARGGHEVTYIAISFHPKRKNKNWGFASWKEDGITVCTYSQFFFPERMNVQMPTFRAAVLRKTLKKVQQFRDLPDVIHVHYPAMITSPDVIMQYQEQGVRIVTTEHWTEVLSKMLNEIQKQHLKQYADGADAFICVGEPLRRSVIELTKTKKEILVVPNVVESIFQPIEAGKRSDNYTFITTARLVKVKQIDKVILAVAELVREFPNIRYIIVGDGNERQNLMNLVLKLKLEHVIQFLGTQPREQVAKLVADSDCLVCYSSLETFGVPIIEAWASGVPVISSDCLGFSEYWKDGLGYIVDHQDVQALIASMKRIIAERGQYDRKQIVDYARNEFSEQTIRSKLEKIYSKV